MAIQNEKKINLIEPDTVRQVKDSFYERVIYVAHPYFGYKSNEEEVALIIQRLQKIYPNYLFISPIHAFSYDYASTDYQTGIERCLYLLEKICTDCWVFGDWQHSKGVQWELTYAHKFGIPYEVIWSMDIDEFLSLSDNTIKQIINGLTVGDYQSKYVEFEK